VLDAFGIDRIITETGVGQTELDIARTADSSLVVLGFYSAIPQMPKAVDGDRHLRVNRPIGLAPIACAMTPS
jgi:hypothetical protein